MVRRLRLGAGAVMATLLLAGGVMAAAGHAALAATPTADPIVGDWNVTYGAPAVVTMSLSGTVYTETAKTPVVVTGGSCALPAGTVIATFSSIGGAAYSGQHGLWFVGSCVFAQETTFSLVLSADGTTLTGSIGNGEAPRFTRVAVQPAPATPQPSCSKAAALEVAKPYFHWGSEVTTPVAQVLCGSFAGPGSDAMAVTFSAPTCWSPQGWAVFRRDGGQWRLVMAREGEFLFPLVAVGSDIRETVPVRRGTDPRCVPSGGTRARTWHWNGTRLNAGPWKQVTPPKSSTRAPIRRKGRSQGFASPTGNLICVAQDDGRAAEVHCQSQSLPSSVTLQPGGGLKICHGLACVGDPGEGEVTRSLGYGRQLTIGRFRCRSEKDGVTCTVIRSGRGFRINAAGVTRV